MERYHASIDRTEYFSSVRMEYLSIYFYLYIYIEREHGRTNSIMTFAIVCAENDI